jgi:hypothetical protein
MALVNVPIQDTDTDLIVAAEQSVVFSIIFCNISSGDVDLTTYAIPSGGSVGTTNCIINNFTVPANDSLIWTSGEKFILDAGDKITANASAADDLVATINFLVI